MRVALTCGMDFSRPNGVTRYVEAVASGLAQEYDIHLLSSDEPSTPMPVTVHLSPIRKLPWMRIETRVRWLRSLLNVVQLTTRLVVNAFWYRSLFWSMKKRNQVDIFHSQSLDSPLADVVTMHACYAAAWGRKKGELHGLSLRGILGYMLFLPFNQGSLAIERRILHQSHRVIAVSPEVKHQILAQYQIPERKIVVIPNGVDTQRFCPDPEKRSQCRARYGIPESEMVLLFVGNLFQMKGLDLVFPVLEEMEGVSLFVIGDDVNLESYRDKVQKSGLGGRVIFTGKITSGIENYYAASDVYVLPSESEGFPLSALEAAASGLPLLTTRVGGLLELLDDGKNGYFIRRDAEDIANRLKEIISDPAIKKKMGNAARMKAEEYSWGKVVQKILEVYSELKTIRS
jgi:UDP-glucose:(heptosyl)LPS alpha-1,3-glucosyltransferase